jgi:hypothetical protein
MIDDLGWLGGCKTVKSLYLAKNSIREVISPGTLSEILPSFLVMTTVGCPRSLCPSLTLMRFKC